MKATTALLALALLLVSCDEESVPQAATALFSPQDGYILQFGDDFEPGRNFVDDFGVSVALVVDVSGSMGEPPTSGGEAKFIQAAHALATVADYLETLTKAQPDLKIQVALFKFSNGVEPLMPLTVLDTPGLARLKFLAQPESFQPDGGTAIGKALEKGSEVLAQSGTIFNSLILVTDGENNGEPDPVKVIQAIYTDRNSAATPELRVTTSTQLLSFIGFDIQSPQFQVYHQEGARVMSADNQVELETSLKALLEADITKLEGK